MLVGLSHRPYKFFLCIRQDSRRGARRTDAARQRTAVKSRFQTDMGGVAARHASSSQVTAL